MFDLVRAYQKYRNEQTKTYFNQSASRAELADKPLGSFGPGIDNPPQPSTSRDGVGNIKPKTPITHKIYAYTALALCGHNFAAQYNTHAQEKPNGTHTHTHQQHSPVHVHCVCVRVVCAETCWLWYSSSSSERVRNATSRRKPAGGRGR